MFYSFLDPINVATILWITLYVVFLAVFLSAGGICMSVYLKLNPLKPISEEIPESLMERGPSPVVTSTVHPIVKV